MQGDVPDLKTLKAQAFSAMNAGHFDVAEPLYIEALRQTEATSGKEHPDTATLLQTLGDAYLHVSRFAEAIPYYQQLLNVGEALLGDSHPNVANVLYKLSKCYDEVGDRHSAVSHAGRALDVARRCFPADHPNLDLLRELYQTLMKPQSQPFKSQHPPSTMPSQGGPGSSRNQMPSQGQGPGPGRNQMPSQGQGPGSSRNQMPSQSPGPGPDQHPAPQEMPLQPVISASDQQARPRRPQGLSSPEPQSGGSERQEKARRPQMQSQDGYGAPPSLSPRSRPVARDASKQPTGPNPEELEAQYQSGSFIHPFAHSQLTGSHEVQQDLPSPSAPPPPKPSNDQFSTGSYTHPLNQPKGSPHSDYAQGDTGPLPVNETTSQDFFRNPGSLNFTSSEDDGWKNVGEGVAVEDEEEEGGDEPLHEDRDWKNQMMSGWPGHAGRDLADTNNSWIVSNEIKLPPSRSERSKSREFESFEQQSQTGGQGQTGSMKPLAGRREEGSSEAVINFAKMARTTLPPLLGFLLLAGIGIFLFQLPRPSTATANGAKPIQTAKPVKAATSKTYQSADGQITIKLLSDNLCELTLGTERKQIAYQTVDGTWHDLPSIVLNTLLHREYFFQSTPQGLQTQEGAPVYSMASLDFSVIMQMRELAAFAEEYKMVAGPGYPTQTSAPGLSHKLTYVNAFSGKIETAPFVAVPISDGSDGQHVIEDLERSNRRGPENEASGSINTYVILIPVAKAFVGKRFLITGAGSNAKMINGTKLGASCYVLESSTINSREKPLIPKALPPPAGVKKGIPDNAVLRIVTQPCMPLFIMHHFLPLVTGTLAVLLFWRSLAAPGAATWAPSASNLRTCRIISVVLLLMCIVTATIQALL